VTRATRALHSEHVSVDSNPSPRPISTGPLNALLRLHVRPKPGLLPGALTGYPVGSLISRWASHLDAFSAYPVRT